MHFYIISDCRSTCCHSTEKPLMVYFYWLLLQDVNCLLIAETHVATTLWNL
jgi:hypothetical protein